jgi:tetratricopeptide (TPR) repeat protein
MTLDGTESSRLWERFRTPAPGYFKITPEAQVAWHLDEMTRCEGGAAWLGAAWHVERLGLLRPLSVEEQYRHRKYVGAAHYRDGRYAAALDALQEANKLDPQGGTPEVWLLLALTHHRLQHPDEARTWLLKATRDIEAGPPPGDLRELDRLGRLRGEAMKAIDPKEEIKPAPREPRK